MPIYEDNNLLLYRKKNWIPSSFWNNKCFLDIINKKKLNSDIFEHWLLNRLDNDTWWLLYFAKSTSTYNEYKKLQKQGKIKKIYYTQVYGQIHPIFFWINKKIYHSKSNKKKMTTNILDKRWKEHNVITYCEKIYYDKTKNISFLKIIIKKWIRHQIRCHLASIWHPIVNDKLYCNKKLRKKLWINKESLNKNMELYSLWLIITD